MPARRASSRARRNPGAKPYVKRPWKRAGSATPSTGARQWTLLTRLLKEERLHPVRAARGALRACAEPHVAPAAAGHGRRLRRDARALEPSPGQHAPRRLTGLRGAGARSARCASRPDTRPEPPRPGLSPASRAPDRFVVSLPPVEFGTPPCGGVPFFCPPRAHCNCTMPYSAATWRHSTPAVQGTGVFSTP